jgi:hypothetical protein
MVWGCIHVGGMLDLIVINGTLTGRKYVDTILSTTVKDYHNDHPDMIYQHDGAPAHRAHVSRDYLEDNNINLLKWPAQSPDLNIIENVWQILKEEVGDLNHVGRNEVDELIRIIKTAWDRIRNDRPEIITNLYASIPNRLRECMRVNGRQIKY